MEELIMYSYTCKQECNCLICSIQTWATFLWTVLAVTKICLSITITIIVGDNLHYTNSLIIPSWGCSSTDTLLNDIRACDTSQYGFSEKVCLITTKRINTWNGNQSIKQPHSVTEVSQVIKEDNSVSREKITKVIFM